MFSFHKKVSDAILIPKPNPKPTYSFQNRYWNLILVSNCELRVLPQNPNHHCKYLSARCECNDIVIFIYSHYPLDPNAKLSDTKCFTLSIRWICIHIKRLMTVYENYNVIAFKSCIQIFPVIFSFGGLLTLAQSLWVL